jgi:hypothetical protein
MLKIIISVKSNVANNSAYDSLHMMIMWIHEEKSSVYFNIVLNQYNQVNSRNRVLEKVTIDLIVKKFSVFYGVWTIFTVLKMASLVRILSPRNPGHVFTCYLFNNFPGSWSWPLTSSYWLGQENLELCIHFPVRHHGGVLNELNTGTTLPFIFYLCNMHFISFLQSMSPIFFLSGGPLVWLKSLRPQFTKLT